MNILFLDDDPNRIKLVTRHCINHNLYVVTTAQDAIASLRTNSNYDLVSLDHDLGGEQMVSSGRGTGYEVAEHISKMSSPPLHVNVHSFNPTDAKNMYEVLHDNRHIKEISWATFNTARFWTLF